MTDAAITKELETMSQAYELLSKLDSESKQRALRWLTDKINADIKDELEYLNSKPTASGVE